MGPPPPPPPTNCNNLDMPCLTDNFNHLTGSVVNLQTIEKHIKTTFDGGKLRKDSHTYIIEIPERNQILKTEKIPNRKFKTQTKNIHGQKSSRLVPVFRAEGPYNQRFSVSGGILLQNKSGLAKPGYFNKDDSNALWVSIGNPIRTIELAVIRKKSENSEIQEG